MADVHDKKTRSFNMSRIKSKDTKPEILVRSYLFNQGYRFRIHCLSLPGKPDIVLPKFKTVIFINGCFWHGHENCKYFIVPKTRAEWWIDKINKTRQLDKENIRKLKFLGWKVLTIFECELRRIHRQKTLDELVTKIY